MGDRLEETVRLLEKVCDDVKYEARKQSMVAEGDYKKDGLLYCHVCNEPKETRFEFLDNVSIVPCLCRCDAEKREAEEQQAKTQAKLIQLIQARSLCFESKHLWKYTFDACEAKESVMYTTAVKYVENFDRMKEDGQGLLYFGSMGYGKTYIAASIANALIDKGYKCYMGSMASIAASMYDNEAKQKFLKDIKSYDLLIIDDLGAERDTSYMEELVYLVIDRRYHAHLPTVVTTNMTGDQLKKPTDKSQKRIISRLYEMCIFIEVSGKDRRRLENKENYDKYRELLGLPGKE